jgi:hypothetical protein
MLTPILDRSLDLEVLLKKLDTVRCPSFSTLLPLLFNFASFGLCITPTLTLHDPIVHFTFATLTAVYNLILKVIHDPCSSVLPSTSAIHDLYDNPCPQHQLTQIILSN